MKTLLRFLCLAALLASGVRGQNINVQADATTGLLWRPSTFFSGNGIYGTGNAFTQFTGPLSTVKTFTLPNASATILTDNAVVTGAQGGTGVANTGKTITLGGSFTTSGSFASTLTLTGITNVTLPTSGTLATLAGSESLTNKKLGSLTSNGLVTTSGGDGTLSVTVPGTGVLTALGVNVGSAGAPVLFNGALGTPSSGTVTNLTGTASININGTVGATTPAAGTFLGIQATGVTVTGGGSSTVTLSSNSVNFNRSDGNSFFDQLGIGRSIVIRGSASSQSDTTIATIGPTQFAVNLATNSTSSTTGTVSIGNGSAATNVGIGGGNIFAGGTINSGGVMVMPNNTEFQLKNSAGTGKPAIIRLANDDIYFGDDGSTANDTYIRSKGFASGIRVVATTGAVILAGALVNTPDTLSGAGAISVTTSATEYTSTGGAQALTLANGTNGQIKHISHGVDGGSGVLTPTTKTGFSTITFTNAGDSVTLMYFTTRGWMVQGSYGVTIAP